MGEDRADLRVAERFVQIGCAILNRSAKLPGRGVLDGHQSRNRRKPLHCLLVHDGGDGWRGERGREYGDLVTGHRLRNREEFHGQDLTDVVIRVCRRPSSRSRIAKLPHGLAHTIEPSAPQPAGTASQPGCEAPVGRPSGGDVC